ncbi:DUF2169 domain-containing protein [Defluviimonas aestuarii]|uniref:DUF2169 family type VI secretion system accessory protein n=1 Tax=Albidovulum aestuarii TaxID=1130726 RepID=UPI00249B9EED|nr:DUF2169 domain-containing protein [Defluviimonas aestuarii]MDI3337548.1 DUF2169 domain-containing protein [Defluviimonas aestuarii]
MGFDIWLENRTPFAAATHVQFDAEGQEVLLIMISASFEDPERNGALRIAEIQLPVAFSDEPYADRPLSSVRHEADIAPEKPGCEVIVLGAAHAPGGKPAERVDVGLQAGPVRKVLTVTGDRATIAGGESAPVPFRTMPIVWERSFGGSLEDGDCEPRNPVGIGWKGARSADPRVRTDLANIAYKGDARATRPAGFGPVGRGWQPRLALAGTYDAAWLARQWPLPPTDFDPRHNLLAPPDQWADSLPPGTPVTLINMTPEGRWSFHLPRLAAPLHLIHADRVERIPLAPDTLILEPDLGRVTLKARHPIRLLRNVPRLTEIALGHVSPVWLNARRKGKTYVNPLGGDGTLSGEPVWLP